MKSNRGKIKKFISVIMASVTLVTAIPTEKVLAEAVELGIEEKSSDTIAAEENSDNFLEGTEEVEVEDTEVKYNEVEIIENDNSEENDSTETIETTEQLLDVENSKESEKKISDLEEEAEEKEAKESYLLQYLVVNASYVAIGESQQIVVGIDCEEEIEGAVLQYHNRDTGETFSQSYANMIDGALLFEMLFNDETQMGVYQLDAVIYQVNGQEYTNLFSEAGIEAVFGVNEEVEVEADAVIEGENSEVSAEEDIDLDIVRIDENGNTISEISMEEAISNASVEQVSLMSLEDEEEQISAYSLSRASELVVVLDPGHDNTHAGAQANGLREEVLNLKIALYCKAELEQYQGVKVYLTRSSDGSCPYPGTTSTVCNKNRVEYAKSVGANIFVSIHNNSSSSSTANGATVYYPNSNYNSSVGAEGKGLAQEIEKNLVALGLYNNGVRIRNSEDNTTYPDGSLSDYYGVIRNSKLAGIPAVIVEHAFMTNGHDVSSHLATDAQLKELGVADATAIASYYGLSKTVEIVNVTAGAVTVSNLSNIAGTALMSVTNVSPLEKISKVSFAVWSKSDQSDLKWYDVANNGTGTYQSTLNISNHQYNMGNYNVDTYAYDIYGNSHYIGGTTCTFSTTKVQVSAVGNTAQTVYTISTSGVTLPGGVNAVKFAVWSATNGQDDLVWYTATKDALGIYTASVPILNHKTAGTYYVDAYAVNAYNIGQYIGGTSFEVENISGGSITIENINGEKGQFDVIIEGISSSSEIWRVQIPVWSKSDQSDIYWYTATRQTDGSYIAHVDIANHGYAYASYNVDVYAIAGNGIEKYLGGKAVKISPPKAQVIVAGNETETNYTVNITDLKMAGIPQNIKVAVWSAIGGQDDLIWYTANKNSSVEWSANVAIENHKTMGTYYADVYVTDASGSLSYIGGTNFSVTPPSIEKIQITNKSEGNGTFDVVLTGLISKSGVSKVQVPVWSKPDQSDIYWYIAERQADGSYKAQVSLANHGYGYGKYSVDVYVITATGIQEYMGGTTTTVNVPTAVVNAVGNSVETDYTVTVSNAGISGGIKSLSMAVWSKIGGQDDLMWYTATKKSEGIWTTDIPIINHKAAGLYYVDVYAKNSLGNSVYLGGTTFEVSSAQVSSISISNVNAGIGKFDVIVSGISTVSGIYSVQVPVWSKSDQSDLVWYSATRMSDGSYVANVNLAKHNYNYGKYYADVYVISGNGISQYVGGRNVTINAPVATITANGNSVKTNFTLTATNVGVTGGVRDLRFAVWSAENGQDDLIWYPATASDTVPGTWNASMTVGNHKTAGIYYVETYVLNSTGNYVRIGGTTFNVDAPTVSSVNLVNYNEADGTFGVKVLGAKSTAGIANVKVAVWSSGNQSDLIWYTATANSDGSYQIGADVRNHQNNTGTYYADAYVTDNNGIQIYAGGVNCSMVKVTNVLHPVMGSTSVTLNQMVAYYRANANYPSFYANTEASTIEAFCKIYIEECQAEGVKAEVAFCQAMKETGFLRYGGNVSISQYNFGGIGSTGPGVAGESYSDVRTGIRAQVQHLKAYGCSDGLNRTCVDTRFKYVSRNTAPYVEWLGIQENPYGKGWATAKNYGYDIVNMVNKLKTI